MGKKEYYEESLKTVAFQSKALIYFGFLVFIGIVTFGNLFEERNERVILWIVIGLIITFTITIYVWVKNNQNAKSLHDQLSLHLKES
jgi:predicted MFS family arabinose efflux permease